MSEKPLVVIHSNGDFDNTSISVDGVPVIDCVAMMFIAAVGRPTIISYTTAVDNGDSIFYKVQEFIVEPVIPDDETQAEASKTFQVVEQSSKLVSKVELERYVPGYLMSVFSIK